MISKIIMNSTSLFYLNLIDNIEGIRARNNKNWMGLLKLALKYSPRYEIKPILQGIVDHDIEVTEAMKEMLKEI